MVDAGCGTLSRVLDALLCFFVSLFVCFFVSLFVSLFVCLCIAKCVNPFKLLKHAQVPHLQSVPRNIDIGASHVS